MGKYTLSPNETVTGRPIPLTEPYVPTVLINSDMTPAVFTVLLSLHNPSDSTVSTP